MSRGHLLCAGDVLTVFDLQRHSSRKRRSRCIRSSSSPVVCFLLYMVEVVLIFARVPGNHVQPYDPSLTNALGGGEQP